MVYRNCEDLCFRVGRIEGFVGGFTFSLKHNSDFTLFTAVFRIIERTIHLMFFLFSVSIVLPLKFNKILPLFFGRISASGALEQPKVIGVERGHDCRQAHLQGCPVDRH